MKPFTVSFASSQAPVAICALTMGRQNELGLSALRTSDLGRQGRGPARRRKRYAEDASRRLAVEVTSTGGSTDHRQAQGRRVRQGTGSQASESLPVQRP